MAFAMALLVLSCSKFTYGGSEGDDTRVQIEIEGAGVEPTGEPCVYKIMASRLVNSLHYVWDDTTDLNIRHGEYYLTAFYADSTVFDIDCLTLTQKGNRESEKDDAMRYFAENPAISMQDIYVSLDTIASQNGRMEAFNPYSFFIKPASGLLACDFKRISALDTAMTVKFAPRKLTQRLTFRLKIRPDADVEITGLKAAVSGVPKKVRVMSGMVRNDADHPTFRQFVDMHKVSDSGEYIYEGTTDVLGLFPPSSSVYTSGPGIFQIEINAVVDDGVTVSKRTFNVGINLKTVIEDAKLMEEAKDKSGYRIVRPEALLEVPVVLEVTHDNVISGEGEGYEAWFLSDADIEIEV